MRAYILEKMIGSDGIVAKDLPSPSVGVGQVRVRMQAASLNYRDTLVLGGAFAAMTLPDLVPISDGAGEVVEIGAGVWRVQPGDRVALTFHPDWIGGDWEPAPGALGRGGSCHGVLREELVVDQNETVLIPDHLSFEEAATLPCAAVTAWSALTAQRLYPGDTVLVQGTGGVALFALQFAKLFGLRVIVTSSSPAKLAKLRTLGADETIDYTQYPEWQDEVLRVTAGKGVDLVVEVGGGATFPKSIMATRQGGSISLVGLLSGAPEAIPGLFFKGLSLNVIRVGSREDFVRMNRAIGFHKFKPVIDCRFKLEEIKDALSYLQSGSHVGKIVIRMDQRG